MSSSSSAMLWAVDRRVEVSGAELRGESGMDMWVEGGALVASDNSSSATPLTVAQPGMLINTPG